MKIKCLIFTVLGIFYHIHIISQQIVLKATDKPLNLVLLEIRDKYGAQFSFNDAALSKYNVNISKSFTSLDSALEYLLKDVPFLYEKESGVYIIYPKKIEIVAEKPKPKIYSISGKILEFKTNELLPYSQITINSAGTLSDEYGNFYFTTTKDSIFRIKISQLGYYIKDTIVYSGRSNIYIYMVPADQVLSEITVNENLIENFSNSGNEPGTVKLNHKITRYLPGSSDNSVYNLLRLQAGVLASGEQSNDIIIWGSYPGQSRIIFDGITIFGMKNFNDNISAINPLITKNIQLKKGAYDASFGDCVGGIVQITGKDGDTQKPHFNFAINNYTLNGLIEIPLLKKSSLQLGYRQTYYNLYNEGFQLFNGLDTAKSSKLSNIFIYPNYSFRDFNVKYTWKSDNNLFYISFLNGNDAYNYSFTQTRIYRDITKSTDERNQQTGAAIFYKHKFNQKLYSSLSFSFSNLLSNIDEELNIFSTITGLQVGQKDILRKNHITEKKALLQFSFLAHEFHNLQLDFQVLNNNSLLREDSVSIPIFDKTENKTYFTVAFQDVINWGSVSLNPGLRTSYLPYLDKAYLEPRITLSYNPLKEFRFNFGWGIYRQFLVKSTTIDESGNYRYSWVIADGTEIPVLNSNHVVAGLSYTSEDLSIGVEPFFKSTQGLTRYMNLKNLKTSGIFIGDGRSFGIDVYTKYNFKKHTFWLSYTLSKTKEHFNYQKTDDYFYAPQDQRHEIKLATIVDLKPFYLSADYVYGSGFLERPLLQNFVSDRTIYSRLDMAITYKFPRNKNLGECGISILNVLNTENKKYTSFEKVPVSQTGTVNVFYEAVPFTPSVFLKMSF